MTSWERKKRNQLWRNARNSASSRTWTLRRFYLTLCLNKELFIKEREGDINLFYEFQDPPIGQGAFGDVYKGIEKKTREARAIK